eukprot:TRINITY_DN15996_c0_g1_i1.p1 TRINITY_DN15996_c0_g1~~TRINITY_DN15996_c0_g1_i1.p1  ORF type:complete len:1502 (+),score=504.75 TRINITY_DN15996_c0_g1_i1:166-4506(+)
MTKDNVAMLSSMLSGAPEWRFDSVLKAGLRQVTITILEGGASLNLVIRYGATWTPDAATELAVGMQRLSSHIFHKNWAELMKDVPALADAVVEESAGEMESFVWTLAERIRDTVRRMLKSQRENLHDTLSINPLDEVLKLPTTLSTTSLDSPKGNPVLQACIDNIRTKKVNQVGMVSPIAKQKVEEEEEEESSKDVPPNGVDNNSFSSVNDESVTERSTAINEESSASSSSSSGESSCDSDDEGSATELRSGDDSSASSSGSSDSSSSSSSCMKFGDRWDKRQELLLQQDAASSFTEESSPKRPIKTKKKPKKSSSTTRHSVVALKPEEVRQQIILRHLLTLGDTDQEVRDVVLDIMVQNGILERNAPSDPKLEKKLDELLKDGTFEGSGSGSRPIEQSWYKQHFKPIKALGKGGQGTVEQVQNLLDGLHYAVKRIPLPPLKSGQKDDLAERYVRAEVRTLARLRHPYVVRYFIAWFEQEVRTDVPHMHSTETDTAGNSFVMTSFGASNESSLTDGATPVKRCCYIQMEYCYQETLRQAIEKGIFVDHSSLDCGFKIIWQLLECVEYIHKQNVIHRDLKPENIFFDIVSTKASKYFAGDIKVGDFGLATGSDIPEGDAGLPETPMENGHSTGVGTPLYCAPEQERRCDYDSKVDEYSVGVIIFEMFSGFTSGHERHQGITSLRKTGKVPPNWVGRSIQGANLVEVVESLVMVDPARRASAHEILTSGLLPKPRHQEEMVAAVKLFNDYQETMIKLLYEKCLSDPDTLNSLDWLHQLRELRLYPSPPPLLVSSHGECWVKELVIDNFRRMGATEMKIPLQIPANSIIKDYSNAKYMDEEGRVMILPENPAVSYARYLAILHTEELKPMRRYGIGNGVVNDRVCRVAAYDVTMPEGAAVHGVEVELFLLLGSVLSNLSLPSSNTWVVRVNHTELLSVLMEVCKLDRLEEVSRRAAHHMSNPDQFSRSLNIDDKISRKIIELHGSKKLLGQHTSSVFTHVAACLGIKTLFQHEYAKPSSSIAHEVIKRDRGGVLCSADYALRHRAAVALCELQRLDTALVELGFKDRFPNVRAEFDISMTKDCRVYSGMLFSVELCDASAKVGTEARKGGVLGVGGRYTALYSRMRRHYHSLSKSDKEELVGQTVFQPPSGMGVVGLCLNITELTRQCWEGKQERKKVVAMGAAVHVCMKPSNYDPSLLLRVATQVREQGIPADYQLEPLTQIAELQDRCKRNQVQWMLLLPGMVGARTSGDVILQCKLKKLNTGILRKDKEAAQKEELIEAPISQIGKQVAAYLSRSLSEASKVEVCETFPGLRVYGHNGKALPDARTREVSDLARHTFKSQPPSRDCVSIDLPLVMLRETISHLYGHGHAPDPRCRQPIEVIRRLAHTVPVILLHSTLENAFEVVVSANIGSPSDEQQEKHGKRQGGKNRKDREDKTKMKKRNKDMQ